MQQTGPMFAERRRFVIMGVSGCGKTTVGQAVARACDAHFIDGDDLHPQSNIAKMASGVPLNDTDREPWLQKVGKALDAGDGHTLIGCSALRRIYRDWIRNEVRGLVHFVHLDTTREVLSRRVNDRAGHFMPPALLDSQLATLEVLEADEQGTRIDIAQSFEAVVAEAEHYVREILR